MNPGQLLAHFDRIGEAPDAISRLRRFFLEIAVRGKLVPQDSTETVGDSIPEIRPQFEDFDTPKNWRWTEFGEVAAISGGFAFKSGDYAPSGVFVLRVTNIEPSGVISKSDAVFLPKEKISPEIERFYLNAGDILLVMVGGSLGKIGVVLPDVLPALLNQNLWRITPANDEVDRHFLKLLIDFIVSFQRKITHSTHGHLSREDFRKKAIALPPLAEQHRIVAKVDELMALCDRLEAAQTEREFRRDRLVASSLHHLNNGADADAFREHARFYFNHLPRLTTRPDHIKQLRQTILNLAVRGKLAPQDPTDEPASELLKRIQIQKARMARDGKTRKSEPRTQIDEEELPFKVPPDWCWARLATISRKIHYGYTASANKLLKDVRLLRITDIQNNAVDWASVPGCEISGRDIDQYKLEQGDILIARTGGTIGKTFLVKHAPVTAVFASYLIRVQGTSELYDQYLKLFLESPAYWKQLQDGTRGAGQPNVNGQTLGRMVVTIPPLAEQHRIVAKVNELMALCDQLETQLTTTQSESRHLLEAILHEALAPAI